MKKILILGEENPISRALHELILKETDWKVHTTLKNYSRVTDSDGKTRRVPILYDKKTIRKSVLEFGPDFIINCIYLDDINECESNKNNAWEFNVSIAEALTKAAFMTGSHLILFSSDNIYDGLKGPYSEDTKPEPCNYYGKTMLGMENHCLTTNIPFTVVRLPEIYGSNGDFAGSLFSELINGDKISLASNVFTTPVLLDDVALSVIRIIERSKTGLYNLAGPEFISELEFGLKAAEYLNLDKNKIIPYIYNYEKANAKKMLRGGLVNLKAETDLNIKFVNLHSGLTTVRFQINFNS